MKTIEVLSAAEIKDGMTKGVWVETRDRNIQADNEDGHFIADCAFANHADDYAHGYNAAAITTAVNATWNSGYCPVKLLEFVRAMEQSEKSLKRYYPLLVDLLKQCKI